MLLDNTKLFVLLINKTFIYNMNSNLLLFKPKLLGNLKLQMSAIL